jgi:single-strand DNA-binding protein
MNSTTLVGRAGRDPEVRFLETGTCVANLSLAVNARKSDDPPLWFNLEIWGKTAQIAADYVRKGSLIGVTGSFKEDRWTDRTTGEERTKLVVNVDRLELLGPRPDLDRDVPATAPAQPRAAAARPTRQQAPAAAPPFDDSDIPF